MNKIIKISVLLIAIGFLVSRPPLAFSSYEDDINAEIKKLNDQISSQKTKIQDLEKRQAQYLETINQKQSEKTSLATQLSLLDDQLSQTQLEIDALLLNIDQTNLEIKKATLDISSKDEAIKREKDHIANLLRLLYKQDQVSTLEILLLNNSLSDFLDQVKYLENTNEELNRSIDDLKSAKEKIEENKSLLVEKGKELDTLKVSLEDKKNNLAGEQETKNILLDETRKSEKRYQYLLEQARREQLQATAEINSLEKTVRAKLEKQKDNPNLNYNGFIWPVTKNRINATFHDADYPFRRLIGEHSGVDIKAGFGTTIRAAADGYVARVKYDGSSSYAYIMIIHGDGLSTVYGHVSAVYVEADGYVTQGQAIGKSGGLPGAPGSGPFSTGAHLHFEVRKNGLPVNPLDYLP